MLSTTDSYDRFTGGLVGAVLNLIKDSNTDTFIKSLSFANGIKNLSDDYVDYYLRVLALIIPRDKEFLEKMYGFIDAIRELTINSENYDGEIRWRFSGLEERIKDDKINNEGWNQLYFERYVQR